MNKEDIKEGAVVVPVGKKANNCPEDCPLGLESKAASCYFYDEGQCLYEAFEDEMLRGIDI